MMAGLSSQRVMEIMADATNIIAEGEVLQLMNANDPETTEQRYLEVIYRKTARLFEAGAEVAAVLAETPLEMQRSLAKFGRHLGTAYQLVDDVLDYRSDPATRGKNIGDDLAEGKPTLPLIHALKHGTDEQKAVVRSAIENGGIDQLDASSRPSIPRVGWNTPPASPRRRSTRRWLRWRLWRKRLTSRPLAPSPGSRSRIPPDPSFSPVTGKPVSVSSSQVGHANAPGRYLYIGRTMPCRSPAPHSSSPSRC
jgi:hypothetical protein